MVICFVSPDLTLAFSIEKKEEGARGGVEITHNPVLKIDQTYPRHEDYVLDLYRIYKSFTLSPPRIITRKPETRTNKIYSTMRFRTRALPCLVPYFKLF